MTDDNVRPALGELARLAIDDVNEYASAYYAYVMHGAGSGRKTAMDAAYNAFADKLDALVALASGGAAGGLQQNTDLDKTAKGQLESSSPRDAEYAP